MTGVLSGFDRLRLRGTLRHLFQPTVMEAYLNACRVLIKDFGTFSQGLTARIKAAAYAQAEQAGRPFRYLPSSQISKEDLAYQIARQDGVTSGLIAIFSALENCRSYSVRGNRQKAGHQARSHAEPVTPSPAGEGGVGENGQHEFKAWYWPGL